MLTFYVYSEKPVRLTLNKIIVEARENVTIASLVQAFLKNIVLFFFKETHFLQHMEKL